MSHLLMDIEEVSPTTSQLKATDLVSALNQRTTDSYNHDDQQYHAGSTRVDLQPWAYCESLVSIAVNLSANEKG